MTIKLLVVRIASFTFLVCPHYTGNRFSCRHENVSGSMSDNRIELEQVVHTHRTSYQSGRLAERPVSCTKSQCSLLKIYFHIRWNLCYNFCSSGLVWKLVYITHYSLKARNQGQRRETSYPPRSSSDTLPRSA